MNKKEKTELINLKKIIVDLIKKDIKEYENLYSQKFDYSTINGDFFLPIMGADDYIYAVHYDKELGEYDYITTKNGEKIMLNE